MRIEDRDVGRVSAVIYGGLSALSAATFFLATLLTGDYSWVSRIGGSIWIFLLAMIILMPTVTPMLRAMSKGHLRDVRGGGPQASQ